MCDNCDKKKNGAKATPIPSPISGLGPVTAIKKPYFSYKVAKPNWVDKTFYTYQYFQQTSATTVRYHIIYYIYSRVNKQNKRVYATRTYFDQTLSTDKINAVLNQISNNNYSSAIPNVLDFNNKNIETITAFVNQKAPKAKATSEDIISMQQNSYPGGSITICGDVCMQNSDCPSGCDKCDGLCAGG